MDIVKRYIVKRSCCQMVVNPCNITPSTTKILRLLSLSLTCQFDAADCITMCIGDGQTDCWSQVGDQFFVQLCISSAGR